MPASTKAARAFLPSATCSWKRKSEDCWNSKATKAAAVISFHRADWAVATRLREIWPWMICPPAGCVFAHRKDQGLKAETRDW